MNVNMVVPALILLIPTVWGIWRGALRMVFSLGSLILAVVLTGMLQPKVSDWLGENTSVYETIKTEAATRTEKAVDEFLSAAGTAILTPEGTVLTESMPAEGDASAESIPAEAVEGSALTEAESGETTVPDWANQLLTQEQQAQLLEILDMPEKWRADLQIQGEMAAGAFVEKVSTFIADTLWKLMTNLLTFAIVMILIHLISGALKIVEKLPGIHGANKLLGGVLGFAEGALLLWLLTQILGTAQGLGGLFS